MAYSTPIKSKGHLLTVMLLKNDQLISAGTFGSRQPFPKGLLGQLVDFIAPGSTVVDAGANLGVSMIFFAAQTGPSVTVHAFEPQMHLHQMLCANAVVNNSNHIRTHHKALSEAPGILHIHVNAKLDGGSFDGSLYSEVDKQAKYFNYGGMRLGLGGEEVQAVTLDSFNFSVMKVDVQEAENLMFFGAQVGRWCVSGRTSMNQLVAPCASSQMKAGCAGYYDTIRHNMPVIAFEATEAALAVAQEAGVSDAAKRLDVMNFLQVLGYKQHASLVHLETGTG